MTLNYLFWLLLILPALGSLLCYIFKSADAVMNFVAYGMSLLSALVFIFCYSVLKTGPVSFAGQWFYIDTLSALHLVVMAVIFGLNSLYARIYFLNGPAGKPINLDTARKFGALWFGTLTAIELVLFSNNLGVMWVGLEAVTLITAFLICLHVTPVSLEATWKYLIVCSVGVAFAFMGILLIGAASSFADKSSLRFLNWTELKTHAASFDPKIIKLAFIFLFVGYGTKAGLAPMHSWLPDAHSQAPAPVSALFSGFLLNSALYCIMRFIPIVEPAAGAAWVKHILLFFGLFSILVSAAFIVTQHNLKRLLAYCSVEHIGIITVGLGLGPLGAFAALFHSINHSLAKTLSFWSAGHVGKIYGTYDMRNISGVLKTAPLWGIGLLGSSLALIGVAPFAIFLSEFFILKAAAQAKDYVTLALSLAGAGMIFIGMLRMVINMSYGAAQSTKNKTSVTFSEVVIVGIPLAALLILGLWMPQALRDVLTDAAKIIWSGNI
ncbi:MAG: proton-conducting transporter membrane subunit [Candidatus Brocadiia bacterium]